MSDYLYRNDVLTGSYLPREVSEHLGLVAVNDGVSKSHVIESLVKAYLKDKPIDSIINRLAEKTIKAWKESTTTKGFNLTLPIYFERKIKPKLKRRKISDTHIVLITEKINEFHKKR